ncbi:MAG: acyl-CoA dehydrogenase family protein [Candidatus Sumerlaeia bacterium]|nr:acyl-CoA dehydrogenase family protein [Candidatus Sumerlaeia bacterium]
MDYGFTEQQMMIRDLARQVAEEKVLPVRAELDEKEEFPFEAMKALADADLFGIYIPQAYGGFGGGALELCIATEELSRICGGVAVSYAANALGAYPILLHGTEEQKQKYLPDIAAGRKFCAFALTEPNVGSDASAVETTAKRDGDYYILNGSKQWITNGGVAGTLTVMATVNKAKGARGLTAFIIESGMPGFTLGKKEKKLGIRCSDTRVLYFDNCRVPVANRLGREGDGFRVAMNTFDCSRPGIGAQAVGIAQGAYEEAVKFAKTREQFGQKIIGFQAIQHMLADMATQIEAARLLVYQAAREVDKNSKDGPKISAMAKMYASDVAMKVTTDALQICGGAGYMREYPVEKYFRDAKITQIYEGTNQIQRNVIALSIIRESRDWK